MATPIYDKQTGRLAQLVSDTNQDGQIDTRAHLEGVRLKFIEIDRDFDGRFDRLEFYVDAPGTPAAARAPDGRSVIERAENTDAAGVVIRREFYIDGLMRRVEEDTDADGRVDKWEEYERGVLVSLAFDLESAGRPTRRLIYGPQGQVERIEEDRNGDGQFEAVARAGRGGSQPWP